MTSQSWYSIKNLSDDAAEVSIYDEIGFFGISAKSFLDELKAVGNRRITLRINSPGGSVFDGTAIYNRLKDHAPGVDVMIDGLAASIASVIAMAGSKITMAENALLMIHNASGVVMGNAEDMRQLADTLDKIDGTIAATYARRTGKPAGEMAALMDAETWFTAAEAKEAGFIDEIDEPLQIAAKFSGTVQNNFKNAPAAVVPAPSEAELAFAAALDRCQSLDGEVIELKAKISEQHTALETLRAELAADRAKLAELEAREKRIVALQAKLKAASHLAPAAVVPPVAPDGDAPKTGEALLAEFESMPPGKRSEFFRAHKAALIAAYDARKLTQP